MIAIRSVTLGDQHLHPGRTRHTIADKQGKREFPPFVALKITHCPGESGYFLMHICEDGQVADTWHQSLDDAMYQAEWELGVQPQEWIGIDEPF
jgi:hypothetical protein